MGTTGSTSKTEVVVQRLSAEVVKVLKQIKGVKNVQSAENGTNRIIIECEPKDDLMAEISRTVVGQNAGLIRMSPVQLALEEYYLNLIGGRRSTV